MNNLNGNDYPEGYRCTIKREYSIVTHNDLGFAINDPYQQRGCEPKRQVLLTYTISVNLDWTGTRDMFTVHIDFARVNVSLLHPDTEREYVKWLATQHSHTVYFEEKLTPIESYNARSGHLFEIVGLLVRKVETIIDEKLLPFKTMELNAAYRYHKSNVARFIDSALDELECTAREKVVARTEDIIGVQLTDDKANIKGLYGL